MDTMSVDGTFSFAVWYSSSMDTVDVTPPRTIVTVTPSVISA